ncbi:uncharacterized protein K452DRAFT_296166 [Aplosporella prunicola CBS 121167]|uniref:RING-type domain-containing protein n=1 Tax=Aplosporella prunicola CBS 121167 TaxID=1176127 RepID=A0A6A6BQB6_9PEZI|nr:uncharacterized protein K452DRAFT_296166 [Aplosporella prunicola CBS 121167]KAF2144771.1 hypothetical protein K452DRAFT_296166 [Aplosporella prunicola CBS 121167]
MPKKPTKYPAKGLTIEELVLPVSVANLKEKGKDCCSICLDEFLEHTDSTEPPETTCKDPVKLSCGHTFGHDCIQAWFYTQDEYKLNCPYCRVKPRTVCTITSPEINMMEHKVIKYRLAYDAYFKNGARDPNIDISPALLRIWGERASETLEHRVSLRPFLLQRPHLYMDLERIFFKEIEDVCTRLGWKEQGPRKPSTTKTVNTNELVSVLCNLIVPALQPELNLNILNHAVHLFGDFLIMVVGKALEENSRVQ